MEGNFGIHDDRRKLYGWELCTELRKYCHAIIDVWYSDNAVCNDTNFHDTHMCIIKELLDLGNPHESDEGIEKGEFHKRNRVRFANGVFKAFFDKKIIDEKVYDQLFKNLRENLLSNRLDRYWQMNDLLREFYGLEREGGKFFKQILRRGIRLRSGKILPSNDHISEHDSSDEESD